MKMNYDECKYNLQIRLCDLEHKPTIIEDYPVIHIGDWIGYFVVAFNPIEDALLSITITNDMLSSSEITQNQLYEDALTSMRQYTPLLFSMVNIFNMDHFTLSSVENLFGKRLFIRSNYPEMFTLTNENGVHGAGYFADSKVRASIGDSFGCGYYVIPSSVHELLLIPDSTIFEPTELIQMVQEVNADETVIVPADILSNKVMWCSKDGNIVENINKHIH